VRQAALLALLGFTAASGRLVAVRATADAQASVLELEADRPLSFTTLKLSGPPRVVVDLVDTELGDVAREQEVSDGTVRRVAVAAAGSRTARVVIELAGESEFDVRAAGNRIEVRVQRLTSNVAAGATSTSTHPIHQEGSEIQLVRERAALPTVALAAPAPPPQDAPTAPLPRATAAHGSPPAGRTLALAAITGIGFRPMSGGEVLVRSDRPLEYDVSTGRRAVLLHLPRAAIPHPNNRRPLDTRIFGGPVQRVVPLQVDGGTDVRIELRQPAQVHLEQTGSLLTVSFTPSN